MRSIDEAGELAGCKFADRCPAVMERCWTNAPQLYSTDPDRVVRCFIYEDEPVLESNDVTTAFTLVRT